MPKKKAKYEATLNLELLKMLVIDPANFSRV